MPISISGTTGVSLAGQFDSASTFGFKNRIINGAMMIDQRNAGASQSVAVNTKVYTVDRWYCAPIGNGVTTQQVAGSGSTQYRFQVTGASGVTNIYVGQPIEQKNCYDLAGQTVTVSLDLANSLLTTVSWSVSYAASTDNWSSNPTTIASGSITVNSTVTRYSFQVAIPAAATTGLRLELSVGAQTSGTWTIGNVQLEKGSTATSFDYRPYGTELMLCQRYYQKLVNNAQSPAGYGNVDTASAFQVTIPTAVQMRATPTYTDDTGRFRYQGNNITPSGYTPYAVNSNLFNMLASTSGASLNYAGTFTVGTGASLSSEL